MGSMKGKQAKIDAAFGRLADMIPSGSLLAGADPVGFLDTVAAELRDLRVENVKLKGAVSIKQDRVNDSKDFDLPEDFDLVKKLRSYNKTSGYTRFMRMAADVIVRLSKPKFPFTSCKNTGCNGPGVGKCGECSVVISLYT